MINIYVRKQDIEEGIPNNSLNCPITRAVQRKLNVGAATGAKSVHTWTETTLPKGKYYVLPESAREFILNFDMGRKVKPFSFRLKEKE